MKVYFLFISLSLFIYVKVTTKNVQIQRVEGRTCVCEFGVEVQLLGMDVQKEQGQFVQKTMG